VILDRGAVGVRVKDIAERVGITPSSVLYYYPRIDELMIEVSREAMERYAERRSRRVRRLAIHLGVPMGPDDDESRLLYELDAFVGSSPAFRVLSSSFFDRQVLLYQHILESGAAAGAFELAGPADSLARGLVAMEDGLGLQVVIGHPGLDNAEAERILLRHAGAATGTDLEQIAIEHGAQAPRRPRSGAGP
jgi:AcrR family transcriptional regulator